MYRLNLIQYGFRLKTDSEVSGALKSNAVERCVVEI